LGPETLNPYPAPIAAGLLEKLEKSTGWKLVSMLCSAPILQEEMFAIGQNSWSWFFCRLLRVMVSEIDSRAKCARTLERRFFLDRIVWFFGKESSFLIAIAFYIYIRVLLAPD
jgi:hypothetical protein